MGAFLSVNGSGPVACHGCRPFSLERSPAILRVLPSHYLHFNVPWSWDIGDVTGFVCIKPQRSFGP